MAKFNRVLRESCCVVVVIFHIPHMLLFARFKPAFSFANKTTVAVTAIYFVNGACRYPDSITFLKERSKPLSFCRNVEVSKLKPELQDNSYFEILRVAKTLTES